MHGSLYEKCRNTEFFLVRIFPYSVQIRENTNQKKTPYLDTSRSGFRNLRKTAIKPSNDFNPDLVNFFILCFMKRLFIPKYIPNTGKNTSIKLRVLTALTNLWPIFPLQTLRKHFLPPLFQKWGNTEQKNFVFSQQ